LSRDRHRRFANGSDPQGHSYQKERKRHERRQDAGLASNRSLAHLEPVSGRTKTEIGKWRAETAAVKPVAGGLEFDD
jgi:hypothetical protein